MALLLGDIADRLKCEVIGDRSLEITGVSGLETAAASQLSFLANKKYGPLLKTTKAAAVLVSRAPEASGPAWLISPNPYLDFARALSFFYQPPRPPAGIHPMASIAASAQIGEGASIGAFAAIGERVILGRRAVIHPHVVIYEGAVVGDDFVAHSHVSVREHCHIGHRVTLQNGVVIGGDGFGFAKRSDGSHEKIVQSGPAVLEDDVEIQSLTSIDRATVGETRVKRGAKIDSLVQIGHACTVGEDNIICAQTGMAGSSVLGKDVLLAGQVGLSGHLSLADGVIVYAQSGVGHTETRKGALLAGSPAFDNRDWLRAVTAFQKLGELARTVRQLERQVDQLRQPPPDSAHPHE